MKLEIFTVHDSKADAFLQPFFMHNGAMALRAFTTLINTPDHDFANNPGDYTLFRLGMFDNSTGKIKPTTASAIANGITLRKHIIAADQPDLFGTEAKGLAKENGANQSYGGTD